MNCIRVCLIAATLSLVAGCAYLPPIEERTEQMGEVSAPNFLSYDAKSMVFYAGYIAGLNSAERLIECDKLLNGEAGDISSYSVRLHTAFVMMLTPECGGPERASSILDSMRDKIWQKDLKSLVKYQTALARQLQDSSAQSEELKQQKATLKKKGNVLKKQLKAKEDELEQLKATLDALKQIEKTFHQRNEAGVP